MRTSGPEDRAATRFVLAGQVVACEPYGEGLIHDSFLVTCQEQDRPVRYLLQRINIAVFPDPPGLMRNLRAVMDHLRRRGSVATAGASLAVPTLISTHSGADHHRDAAGSYWRMFEFLEGARAIEPVVTPGQAELVGRAYGRFLRWLASYDGPELGETIPRFHDTEWRYEELERVVASDPAGRVDLRERRSVAKGIGLDWLECRPFPGLPVFHGTADQRTFPSAWDGDSKADGGTFQT